MSGKEIRNSMIYEKNSYVTGSMCDSKLKLSILAADEIVENAVTETMGDLGIDGIVAMEKYKAMWLIAKTASAFSVVRYGGKSLRCVVLFLNFLQ